jgi:hypothetical protein
MVDYIMPQVYFSRFHPKVAYKTLTEWWLANTTKGHLYIGQAAYKVGKDTDTSWDNPSELPDQIRYNRSKPGIKGTVFFSSKSLTTNTLGLADSLKKLYKYPALTPAMSWKKPAVLSTPKFKEKITETNGSTTFTWDSFDKSANRLLVFKVLNTEKLYQNSHHQLYADIKLGSVSKVNLILKKDEKVFIKLVGKAGKESGFSEGY